MPTFIPSFLDLLFLTWAFWPFVIIVPLWCYHSIAETLDSHYHGFPAWPIFWLGIYSLGIAWHHPEPWFKDWHVWAELAAGYVAVGFIVSLYKWAMVLVDFRKSAPAVKIAEIKADTSGFGDTLDKLRRHFNAHVVELRVGGTPDRQVYEVYPDWRKHPIGTWWTYWPFFLLSVLFDPIQRACAALWERAKRFYDYLATLVAVKG